MPPLPVPRTHAGRESLNALVAQPATALVAVDFDGTLAPIVSEPSAVRPHPGAAAVLRALADSIGAVAVVTGRPAGVAAELLGFTAVAPPGNLSVVGHYGLETWTAAAGVLPVAGVDPRRSERVEHVRAALPALLRDVGAPSSTRIEDKGAAVAVHVRETADPHAALELLREPLQRLAESEGLRLEPGRLVLELRPAGTDKGTALVSLVDQFSARSVCYVGDDRGDIAAFDALEGLRSKGFATLGVFSGVPNESALAHLAARADLQLSGPDAVVAFLEGLLAGVRPH
ncbi:MAG TPA: trehalose-phosphatase [Acidothermaceae bacterium]